LIESGELRLTLELTPPRGLKLKPKLSA